MVSTTVFAGEGTGVQNERSVAKSEFYQSIDRLFHWLEANDYKGYDTFDGLSAKFLRPLTFEKNFPRQVLQQAVRRFILNTRPLLGIKKSRSTKGMGFLARGFLRLHQSTSDPLWRERAEFALDWLIENQSKGYSGACWGNHFDYQARGGFYVPKGVPTIVWTSHIAHAFLDGYEQLGRAKYLEIAHSACEHIMRDIQKFDYGDATCISYVPGLDSQVHNSNTLGASLLARTYRHTGDRPYLDLAQRAFLYTVQRQQPEGSWYYAEGVSRWVDNFHTGYVLDCFKYYLDCTGDRRFESAMRKGYEYWKKMFFLSDGTPKYYNYKTLPLDIQCCSQAIDTLVFFRDADPDSLALAVKVARWTIKNMQDRTGYFYYRRYFPWFVNKTATLHWGQATMLCALAGLYSTL